MLIYLIRTTDNLEQKLVDISAILPLLSIYTLVFLLMIICRKLSLECEIFKINPSKNSTRTEFCMFSNILLDQMISRKDCYSMSIMNTKFYQENESVLLLK